MAQTPPTEASNASGGVHTLRQSINFRLLGSVTLSVMCILLVIGSGTASASAPVHVWHPPYTAPFNLTSFSSSIYSCPTDTGTFVTPGFFNASTGHFGFNLTSSSNPGHKCTYGYELSDFDLSTELSFNSTVGGAHVIRSHWWLAYQYNMTSSFPAYSGPTAVAAASVQLGIYMAIYDSSTNGPWIARSYYNVTGVSGNNSASGSSSGPFSLPFSYPIVLTKGDHYLLIASITVQAVTDANGAGNTASLQYALGTTGHPSEFRGIVIH